MTIEDIKQGNISPHIIFSTEECEEAYKIGLSFGVEIAEKEIIEKACNVFKSYLINNYVTPPMLKSYILSEDINEEEMYRMQYINNIVYRFRKSLELNTESLLQNRLF